MAWHFALAFAAIVMPLCAPTAAATVDQASQYLFEAPHRLTYKNVLAATDVDESRVRGTADGDGNGDVSAQEAETFMASLHGTAANVTSGPLAGLTLDDRSVATIVIENLTQDALTGPVARRGGLILEMRATVTFHGRADAEALSFRAVVPDAELDPRNLSIVTIAAPPGYAILSHDGLSGAQLSTDERTVSGKKSTAFFTVEFGEPAPHGAPTLGAALLVAVVAVVAACTQRRLGRPFRNR